MAICLYKLFIIVPLHFRFDIHVVPFVFEMATTRLLRQVSKVRWTLSGYTCANMYTHTHADVCEGVHLFLLGVLILGINCREIPEHIK